MENTDAGDSQGILGTPPVEVKNHSLEEYKAPPLTPSPLFQQV